MRAAALFARRDSIYKTMPELDVYDIERDARSFRGGLPVIAHPPCRAWGRLRWNAKPLPGEKELALFAVEQVRKYGGVLEHPEASALWDAAGLPRPDPERITRDEYGGWTLAIAQLWFGHRAEKRTWLYIVGIEPADIPDFPLFLGEATHVIAAPCRRANGYRPKKGDPEWRPEVTDAEREHTPARLAEWLVDLVSRIAPAGGKVLS